MNRREFLAGLVKLGISAALADKLELFERLTHKRKFFPGHNFYVHKEYALGFSISQEMLEDDVYQLLTLPRSFYKVTSNTAIRF